MNTWKSPRKNQHGVVYVEFLLVFPPLFILFLVILQWSLLSATNLGVKHAASTTVRSAIVVLPDDPVAYEGMPIGHIPVDGSCSDDFLGKFDKLLKKIGLQSGALPRDGKCPGGPRMAAIRFAAITRMVPFAPNAASLLPQGMASAVEALGTAGWIAGAAAYSYGATSVNFMRAPGADVPIPAVDGALYLEEGHPATVRVTYLAYCGIPIARYLMCDSSLSLSQDKNADIVRDIGNGDFTRAAAVSKRIKEGIPQMQLLRRGVGNHELLSALLLTGERFMVLSADATLPLNSAPYAYKEK
ncbi:MAG: pilus assembly protein [Myxococcales bacterium]|nr:pilus assembly protein [Myxococcales bacterium]